MFLEGEEETEHGENGADLRCRVSNSPIILCGERRHRARSGCVISIDESCRRLNRTKKENVL